MAVAYAETLISEFSVVTRQKQKYGYIFSCLYSSMLEISLTLKRSSHAF